MSMSWFTSILGGSKAAPSYDIKVELRAATQGEIKAENARVQNQGRFWKIVHYTWNTVTNAVNTLALLKLDFRRLFGFYINNDPYLSVCRVLNMTVHLTRHPKVMDAILDFHRNDPHASIFKIADGHPTLLLLQKYYPENNVRPEDIILLCSPEETKKYRVFLHQYFLKMKLQAHLSKILDEVTATLNQWKHEPLNLNVTEAARIFTCGVMAKIFLGHPGPYTKICWASQISITHINELFTKKFRIPPADIDSAKIILREAVETAISNRNTKEGEETLVSSMLSNNAFTETQAKIMVFILLIAGQDNSATALTYALLKLAQDKALQENIFAELKTLKSQGKDHATACMESQLIKALLAESLRMLTPVSGVARFIATDTVLKVKNQAGETLREYFVPASTKGKNDSLFGSQISYAARDPQQFGNDADQFDPSRWKENDVPDILPQFSWRPFGSGKHTCPGWPLFYAEFMLLLGSLVSENQLSTAQKGEPSQRQAFTNKLANDVYVHLEKRSSA